MVDEAELKISLVKQMLRKEYIGHRYGRGRHIASKMPKRERKSAEKVLKKMASDPETPVAHYKDKQNSYRLVGKPEAQKYIESLGGDPDIDDEYNDLRIIRR